MYVGREKKPLTFVIIGTGPYICISRNAHFLINRETDPDSTDGRPSSSGTVDLWSVSGRVTPGTELLLPRLAISIEK